MSTRDRIVLIVIVVLGVLVGGWMLVVSPKRKEATKLGAEVSEAQTKLSGAESQLATARSAESQYTDAYASIVSLGKAVPAEEEVPSLIYQLAHASKQKSVDFSSITTGDGSGSTAAATPTTTTAAAGFSQMPFTFVFSGGFFDLEHLFSQLTSFTNTSSKKSLAVSGRLLTIQSVKLSPTASNEGKAGTLTGTITATAYRLPAGQSVTDGATSSSPTGAAASATSTEAPASTTAPAVAKVTP
ncbi:MAG TPA: type 4a pilus biogenesis protein PilO [Solirubrobacteraceae bacterium]|jgi:Tfp pilus assembly protein PilO|nr:type 4a pilus biogenesis protein PilO [Solirubrobacteraceae bacterium]